MTTHEDPVAPRAQVLTSLCGGGSCPTVYGTDRETVIVQGDAISAGDAGVDVPDGERLVEIPVEVLLAAADKIRKLA
jgi:hypothetical protein